MLILCIYLTVSIFLYCLCVGLALKDDKEANNDQFENILDDLKKVIVKSMNLLGNMLF